MTTTIIKETQDYRLEVRVRESKELYYAVVNKTYGVEEVDTLLLPRAYGYLLQLQAGLDAERSGAFELDTLANTENLGLMN